MQRRRLKEPKPTEKHRDRDPGGRFAPGNRAAAGKKRATLASAQYKLRRRLVKALHDGDKFHDIIKGLLHDAQRGDWRARRLVLQYGLGQPARMDTREREQIDAEAAILAKQSVAFERLADITSHPSKSNHHFTDELIRDFAMFLEEGLPADGVCDLLGVSQDYFNDCYRRGILIERNEVESELAGDGLCVKLVSACRTAIAAYRLRLVQASQQQRNAISLLERRDPRSFGRSAEEDTNEDAFKPDEFFI